MDQEQANNQRFYLKGSQVDPQVCATFSPAHPLADIFTRPALRLLRNRFPGTCHYPERGESATVRCAGQARKKNPPRRFTLSASKRLLGRCEPDFPDLAEFHMLLGLPEIVVVLHSKPTLQRTAKSLGKA